MGVSAKLDFKVDNESFSFEWKDGQPSEEMLQHISVFDSECARWYTTEKGETRYLPYGMDMFAKLATFCDKLKISFRDEIPQHLDLPQEITALDSDIQLGNIICRIISGDEKIFDEPVIKLTSEDSERLKTLEIDMTLKSEEVLGNEIRTIEGQIKRLEKIKSIYEDANNITNQDAIKDINNKIDTYNSAKIAKDLSQKEKFGYDYLEGTGSDSWKIMYEAAKEFSLIAYPGMDTPYIGESQVLYLV